MIDVSGQGKAAALAARLRFNLRQLEVFVATARAGSTHAAAQRMARSQSAASASLAELEAALQTRLFDRVGRRLVINDKGLALLPAAIALLDQAAELQAAMAGEQRTPLRLAASLTIGEVLLPDIMTRWRSEHPDSPVSLMIGNTAKVIDAVADMAVEVGFIEGPQTHPQLRMHRWLEDELIIVASPRHPLAHGKARQRELGAATWVLREPASGTRQAADAWLLSHLGELNVQYELGSTEAIKRLIAAGVGLACVSRHAVGNELAQGRLVEVETRLPRSRRRLTIIVRRDRRLGPSADGFVRHCMLAREAAGAEA